MPIAFRKMLGALYPRRFSATNALPHRVRIARRRLFYALCAAAVVKIILFWYYYNTFVSLEFDVEESTAQIDTQLQRRKNVILNLTVMVEDYAKHEKGIFKEIAEIRALVMGAVRERPSARRGPLGKAKITTAAPEAAAPPPDAPDPGAAQPGGPDQEPKPGPGDPPAPGRPAPLLMSAAGAGGTALASGDLGAALSRIFAIAERYPTLKLNENFQRFMEALVDAENKIAEQRMIYNERTNDLSTAMGVFPGNLYAWFYGFSAPPFFESEAEARASPKVRY